MLFLVVGVLVADFGLVPLDGARIQNAADAGALVGAAVLSAGDTARAMGTTLCVAGLNWPRSGPEVTVAADAVVVSPSAVVPLLFGPATGLGEVAVRARAAATEDQDTIGLVH